MTQQTETSGMLSGIRVLDFTQYLAGPTVTRFMAELGADIIKVEPAPGGDPSRLLPLLKEGRSIYFIQQNRGKRSLCVDLNRTESQDLLRRLAGEVDVVVENYGPGVLEKRGLDWERLRAINPGLIMASVSAYGRQGPLSDKVGFDLMAQAFSGLSHMTGEPDGPPYWVAAGIGDVNAGVHTFGAISAALFHRERTGQGQHIDISMIDALYHSHEVNVQVYANGSDYVPVRPGVHHPLAGPMGYYRAPSGWIALLVLDRQWPALATALGRPELKDDPRFATGTDRGANGEALAEIIEAWTLSFSDNDSVLRVLEEHRVPAAPVLSVAETVEHPHFRAREMVRQVDDPLAGKVTIPGFPLKFSAFPTLPELCAPQLGEHNDEVLRHELRLDDAELAALAQNGVLHAEPR